MHELIRLGIDLGGSKTEIIALHGSQELLRRRQATPRGDYPATLDTIAGMVEAAERQLGPYSSLGVGIPGTRSPDHGLIKNANSTWLIGQDLQGDLQRRLQRPVRLANDADCFALSEATDGAAGGAPSVFGAILGTGVGGGIVINGQLLAGPNGIAGEWGHNPLPARGTEDGPSMACYCGRRDCIETFLSGPGWAARSQLQLEAEIKCLQDQIELLEEELLDVRARVKLFENRRIPNAKIAIRKIGQKLQDDERLTIATAKVVNQAKLEEAMA